MKVMLSRMSSCVQNMVNMVWIFQRMFGIHLNFYLWVVDYMRKRQCVCYLCGGWDTRGNKVNDS